MLSTRELRPNRCQGTLRVWAKPKGQTYTGCCPYNNSFEVIFIKI